MARMSDSSTTSMTYRPEIDGLCAMVSIAVMLSDTEIPALQDGFLGVDIVISGYLMTTILLPELQQGCFSLLRFYERRVRRLLPALMLVLSCCAVATCIYGTIHYLFIC